MVLYQCRRDIFYVTRDEHTGDERRIDILLAIRGGLPMYKYTGRNHDKKWSMTNEIDLQCSVVDVAVDAGLNMVPMINAS